MVVVEAAVYQRVNVDGRWLVVVEGVVRVTLRLDAEAVSVVEAAGGEEMDRFPLSMIGQVSAVVVTHPRCSRDDLLTFTVLEDAFHMAPPEMYFFHCHDAPV